ncbi:MAG TPA: YutD family protein [Bacillota bacterium]|nr:YutD family protein [Bacillota bacterium]
MIDLYGIEYKLVENIKEGFEEEKTKERYSEILKKYDYIVGDWGYDQLRLKGFYADNHSKATFDTRISTLDDYLLEYCNFGCAYFVLEKIGQKKK